jgi:hypothetical protein
MACEMMRFSVNLVSEAPPNAGAEYDAKYLRKAMKVWNNNSLKI